MTVFCCRINSGILVKTDHTNPKSGDASKHLLKSVCPQAAPFQALSFFPIAEVPEIDPPLDL